MELLSNKHTTLHAGHGICLFFPLSMFLYIFQAVEVKMRRNRPGGP
jgi:hypothetical protein